MTVQMREGWVLLRNGEVDYAGPNPYGSCVWTHPWRLRRCYRTIRTDGRFSERSSDTDDGYDVIKLLDPWDDRVPEEHREKRFVVGTWITVEGSQAPCIFDRKNRCYAQYPIGFKLCDWQAEVLNQNEENALSWTAGEPYSINDIQNNEEHDGASEQEIAETNGHHVDDPVNHPSHYTQHPSGVECIQVTQHMNFCLGNAVKYIWRADLKHDAIEDLKKAAWYINREIERREGK